jgi:hypothetical protein
MIYNSNSYNINRASTNTLTIWNTPNFHQTATASNFIRIFAHGFIRPYVGTHGACRAGSLCQH